MKRLIAAISVPLVALAALTAPAAAIQTSEFGIESAEGKRLEVEVRAGRTSSTSVRVWNRTDGPIELTLDLSPATVESDGTAGLEGDPEPLSWAELPQRRVKLDGGESRLVEVRFEGPSELAAGEHTIAVIAQVVAAPEAGTAVVKRLAPILYIRAVAGTAPDGGLGPAPWIAGLLAAAVAGRTAQVRRNQSTVARSPASSATG